MIIKSHLDRFILIDTIDSLTEETISGTQYVADHAPLFCMVESMAQLGAMHLRYQTDFQRHVFFAKAKRLTFYVKNIVKGHYRFDATAKGHSDRSFAYYLTSKTAGNILAADGIFLFSSLSYDSNFQKERLKNHYERVFSCLRQPTGSV